LKLTTTFPGHLFPGPGAKAGVDANAFCAAPPAREQKYPGRRKLIGGLNFDSVPFTMIDLNKGKKFVAESNSELEIQR
jgi:hypothetical protein